MPDLTIVMVVGVRWLHIVSACVVVGGLFTLLACLPRQHDRDDPLPAAARLFETWFYASVLLLAVSGSYLWVSFARYYGEIGPMAQALIGSKVLLAVGLLVMGWADSVGFWSAGSVRGRLTWKLAVALLVVLLAGVLRFYRLAWMTGMMAGAAGSVGGTSG